MKFIYRTAMVATISVLLFACNQQQAAQSAVPTAASIAESKKQIAAMLDSFNIAAAKADYDRYFNFYTADATFTGTDATEYWDKPAFAAWAKPIFAKGKAWNFTAIKRNIYFGKYADIAWFDELLNTQMKICRGSGVVIKEDNDWKVAQYILSTTVPNNQLNKVIDIKAAEEDSLMNSWKGK